MQLSGRSLDDLGATADAVKAHLSTYPTVYEIADSLSDGKEELRIELKPQGHVLGLTRNDVAGQVGQAFKGFLVQRVQRGRDEVDVLVRLPPSERADVATLDEMLIATPAGRQIPLSPMWLSLIPGRSPLQSRASTAIAPSQCHRRVEKSSTNMTVLNDSCADTSTT